MKKYWIKLNDDLSNIYEDIAKMNRIKVEECLSIILERVIRTMVYPSKEQEKEWERSPKKTGESIKR